MMTPKYHPNLQRSMEKGKMVGFVVFSRQFAILCDLLFSDLILSIHISYFYDIDRDAIEFMWGFFRLRFFSWLTYVYNMNFTWRRKNFWFWCENNGVDVKEMLLKLEKWKQKQKQSKYLHANDKCFLSLMIMTANNNRYVRNHAHDVEFFFSF